MSAASSVGEITIRRMRLEDVPVVHEIDTLSFSLPWPERSFRFEVTENAASRGWVAEAVVNGASKIIAMLVLWLLVDEAHIATVAVHPDFRRCGVASQIIAASLEAARAEGARRVFLEVREGNVAAQEMYLKFGFEITGRRSRYYRDTGEDALLMALERLPALAQVQVSVDTFPGYVPTCECAKYLHNEMGWGVWKNGRSPFFHTPASLDF
jgi:ribosomal-protein-alanine N-acetyltransferase